MMRRYCGALFRAFAVCCLRETDEFARAVRRIAHGAVGIGRNLSLLPFRGWFRRGATRILRRETGGRLTAAGAARGCGRALILTVSHRFSV
ncbi:hypothetical protein [Celeribacter sp.]|uniref:hypothetical protein n=1 Tax=Celeribacter sp. TaxID=1890673 RepID=UPI003A94EA31